MLRLIAETNTPSPSMEGSAKHIFPAQGECEHDASLARFLEESAAMIAADGLLILWHRANEAPTVLLSKGDYDGLDMFPALARCAGHSFQSDSPDSEDVAVEHGHSFGTIITAILPLRRLPITISGVLRSQSAEACSACRDRLASLLPMIEGFFLVWANGRSAAHRMSGLEAALDTTCHGTLLLNRGGHLLFANSSATEFLDSDRGLSAVRGRVTASSLTETLRLNAAIEHLCSEDRSDKGTTPVLAIKRGRRRPLMIALAVADRAEGNTADPVIVARIFDPEHDPAELIAPACRFYGLSPSETRLTRYIVEGRSLAEAAAEIGVREQTARSYLKQIFLKTETNRQAELVALMLRSSVRLAPRCRTQVF